MEFLEVAAECYRAVNVPPTIATFQSRLIVVGRVEGWHKPCSRIKTEVTPRTQTRSWGTVVQCHKNIRLKSRLPRILHPFHTGHRAHRTQPTARRHRYLDSRFMNELIYVSSGDHTVTRIGLRRR